MSTIAEIEAAIEKLRPDEFAELAAWMVVRRRARKVRKDKSRDISKVMDKVFTHHAPLLRKLAQ